VAASASADQQIAEFVSQFYDDPYGFVLACYPWGEDGPLKAHAGPDVWQRELLEALGAQVKTRKFNGVDPVPPIRMAVSSGHGIGKSVVVAWLVDWIMSTRPYAHGTVTANTFTQLQTRTWASIQRWTKLCLTGHWFVINADRIYHPDFKDSWFCSAQSCREENSEAFAGQHAADSTSFYIFDEDSAISETIHDVSEGGLTDGEPMVFRFGNPTRSSGSFYRACFGSERHRWTTQVIDSRTSRFTNKPQIDEWIKDFGEDSDFVRVRVRGLPPAASDLQFIDQKRVSEAQSRPLIPPFPDDPLVCGLDVARGGDDRCVFVFRRGTDARSITSIIVPGEQARDSMRLVTLAADVLGRSFDGRKVDTLFVDGTGIGGPITDRLKQMGHKNVVEVQFGAESPDPQLANMRAFMWSKMKDWLTRGCISKDPRLESDLIGPSYMHDKRDRLQLESKEHMKARGVDSPDDGDALALTFAAVTKSTVKKPLQVFPSGQSHWLG